MKFDVFTRNVAANNTQKAQLRESTRMCAIAVGLERCGHDVIIVDAPDVMLQSRRWKYFSHLFYGKAVGGRKIHPAEVCRNTVFRGDIGIKCSVGINHDAKMLRSFGLVVAHEYAESHERLLQVPFLIHDRSIDALIDLGLFKSYLRNSVVKIREAFPRYPEWELGMCACGWRQRKEKMEGAPEWADIRFYDTHVMTAEEHMHWLCSFKAGLCLPGDTPKTNLPPLLAMLGIPIVMWPIERHDTPPISNANAILFHTWKQVWAELQDPKRLEYVSERATQDYLESWSPIGQARLIAERVS